MTKVQSSNDLQTVEITNKKQKKKWKIKKKNWSPNNMGKYARTFQKNVKKK